MHAQTHMHTFKKRFMRGTDNQCNMNPKVFFLAAKTGPYQRSSSPKRNSMTTTLVSVRDIREKDTIESPLLSEYKIV